MSFTVDDTLDTSGLMCPEPVMMLHNKIRDITSGAILEVVATDPSTERDIPKFCIFLGHQLLEQQDRDNKYFYYIQKK
ncbi:MAG: sulfurtransferase TusA [Spongiibacteraceae bacterium]